MRSHKRIGVIAATAAVVVGALAACAAGFQDKPRDAGPTKAAESPAFEKIKALAGEWVLEDRPEAVASSFRLTAGGSVVIETMFPGTEHEMVNMYHLDGSDLSLTHYCGLGNQPRMKAEKSADAGRVSFKFVGGCNIDPAKDAHMRDAVYTFVDASHLKTEWAMFKDGKQDHVKAFNLVRQKK